MRLLIVILFAASLLAVLASFSSAGFIAWNATYDNTSRTNYSEMQNLVNWSMARSAESSCTATNSTHYSVLQNVTRWTGQCVSVPRTAAALGSFTATNATSGWPVVFSSSSTLVADDINWTFIKNHPVYCPAGSAVTGINDSVTCTNFIQENPVYISSGRVGINTSSPGFALDVNGFASFGGGAVYYGGMTVSSGVSETQSLKVNGGLNVTGVNGTVGKVVCVKDAVTGAFGVCSTATNSSGQCTCA